jgi:hypothetical protein
LVSIEIHRVERNLLVVQGSGIDRRTLFFSALWSTAGSWGRQFLSLLILIVSIVSARLLSPLEIGLISIPAILLLIEATRPAVIENFGQPGSLFICILLGTLTYASLILLTARPSLLHTWAFVRELR